MPVKRLAPAFLFVFLLLLLAPVARAQCVILNTLGSPHNQDFNTLASTGTSSTVPTGWYFSEALTNANTTYTANNGAGTAGETYSYGATGNSERAFGGLQSGNLNPTIGACFTNNTGVTVTNLAIAYTGEEWRLGVAARTDRLDFEYSLNATSLVTGTWTAVNPLDFTTPNTVSPAGTKDGNNASFRTAISSSISPVSIANGATFWIRWLDLDIAGAEDGLAVDDFSITPSVLDVAPSVLTTTPPNGATGVTVGSNIDITFSEPVNVSPGWFTISCTVSGLHAASESAGPTTFTLDPTVNFVTNEICTVTIDDLSVADQDANDPPNNMAADFVWSFDTIPPPPLVVNEIDYDQPGTDAGEFIEIRNNGGSPVNLDPVAVELVNGNLGGSTVYQTIDLPNVTLAAGAYYVICANNTTTPNCNLDVSPNTDLIQNGAPDAVALRWNGVLVDTVSYEGDTGAPYTETSGGGLQDNNTDAFLGISRFPDGGDTGVNNTDLSERCITPGAANAASTTPCSAPAILGISINDVTLAEGQAGTRTFSFTVSLSQPAPPGGVTFDITTADGTAQDDNPAVTEDNDYVAKTLTGQNIPQNATQYTFDVTVNSDPGIEPDETFFVNLTNVVGAPVGDPQGVGTIQNDDFGAITLIHTIQGSGTSSAEVGNVHTIHGVVTGVKSNGFFVQEEDADATAEGNPSTSEGIFVFTSSAPPAAAAMGNLVYVTGTVAEFVPSSDPQQPPVTELTSPSTVLDLSGLPLPAPVSLTPTFPDPSGPHDQLERVEGMRVSAASITVSGPSDGGITENTNTGTSNGRFHGVITGVARPFREPGIQAPDVPPTGTIPPIPRWDFNPERLRIESATINSQPVLTVKSGDVVAPVIGPLDYGFRGYAIYPDGTAGTPVVTPGTLPTTVTDPSGNEVTVATFNMFHFFDDVSSGDGSGTLTTAAYNDRLNKASIAIRNHLKFPDILGVQEFDDVNTLQDLAVKINNDAVANSQPNPMYAAHLMEGNDVGGIDVGYLVKTASVVGGLNRVDVTSVTQHGLNTTWIDPRDGSTDLLHDRPSLVLEAVVNRAPGASFPIVVVNNHLKSLIGIDDNTVNGATTEGDRNRQKRREQAKDIATNLLQPRLTSNPNEHIVLVGDFNAFELNDGYVDPIGIMSGTPVPDNETVVAGDGVDLVNPDFVNLVNTPPPAERYSYVHDGNAQNLDHVIVSAGVVADTTARRIERPRIDADYPETERNNNATPFRISDHEPTVGYLAVNALLVADVSMTKTPSAGPYFAGQTITYTLDVANAGPDPASNIQVTDTPTNLTITNVSGDCTSLPCTIPSLASGGSASITVTATIIAAGAFDNSADADATEADPNIANNTDNTSNGGTAGASADIVVTKSLDTFPPYYRDNSVTYTVIVHNDGPSTATNVQVTDTPTNLTITSVTGDCTSLPCTIPSIASGADASFNVVATITAAGAFDNVASATATENDPDTADNTDNTGNGGTATAAANVGLTKILETTGTFNVGQTITYTITLTNAGPSTATNVQVTDTPTNLTITGVTGACTSLPCTIPSILVGANPNMTVTATIDSVGSFDNSATATPAETDPDTSNNTDNTGNGGTTNAAADLSIVKSFVTPQPYRHADVITMDLVITNNGPNTANNITVLDDPVGMVVLSMTGCTNVVIDPDPINGEGTCTIASLASGASTTVTVTASINNAGQFTNTGAANSTVFDPDTSDNSQLISAVATSSTDLSITKTLNTAAPYYAGQTISYTLVALNTGPSPAVNVQLTDTPANLTITSVSGGCASLPCTIVPALLVNQPRTINVTATINALGAFDNSATVTGNDFDPNTSNNTDNTGNGGVAVEVADVSIVKSFVTPQPYYQADVITMNLVVSNAGPSTATNIVVNDAPVGLTVTNMTGGGCANFVFNPNPFPGNGTCTIPSLASGASVNVTVTASITGTGQFLNTATATATEADPNTANNTSSVNAIGLAKADLSVTKTLNTVGPYSAGQSVSYTIVVNNAGPSPAVNVTLSDTPTNLTITSVSGGCTSLPCNIVPALLVNQPRTINVTAVINAAGPFDNSATVTHASNGPFDPDLSNNTDNTGNGGTAGVAPGDTDGDGVPDTIEQAAPNGGDGNGDGIPDYQQGTVASIPAATGSGYLTLQSSCSLQQVSVTTPGAMPASDPGFHYPHGLIAFRAPCSSATFSLFVYGSGAVSSYRKFGPLPPGGPQQWYGIPATFGTATVGSLQPRRIDFSLTDGGTGDDTPVDGVIVDQGGPAGPGGNAPTLSVWMLMLMAALLGAVALTRLR